MKFPVSFARFRVLEYRGTFYPQVKIGQRWVILNYLGTDIPMAFNDLRTALEETLKESIQCQMISK